jgi:hypothetical protein
MVGDTASGLPRKGQVVRYEDDKVIVRFEEPGEKRLAVDFVQGHRLLEPLQT